MPPARFALPIQLVSFFVSHCDVLSATMNVTELIMFHKNIFTYSIHSGQISCKVIKTASTILAFDCSNSAFNCCTIWSVFLQVRTIRENANVGRNRSVKSIYYIHQLCMKQKIPNNFFWATSFSNSSLNIIPCRYNTEVS